MAERLVKRWDDWSAGVGFPVDDGRTPGMYYASGLLGLPSELRVAPKKNTVVVNIDESHHYQYFFEESLANQTPTIDATSNGTINDSTTNGAFNHTVTSDSTKLNRILIVWVYIFDSSGTSAPTSVTFNGDNLTLAKSKDVNSQVSTYMYYMVAPDEGANAVAVTINEAVDGVVHCASFYNVNQTSPLKQLWGTSSSGTAVSRTGLSNVATELIVAGLGYSGNATVTNTLGTNQTEIKNTEDIDLTLWGSSSYKVSNAATGGQITHTISTSTTWTFVGGVLVGTAPGPPYLYAMRGSRVGNTSCVMEKVDLFNSSFAALETGSHTLTNLLKCGQPTRYQGFWWLPDGDEFDPRKLTVGAGAVSADTLAASSAWTSGGADHLGNMNGQMIAGLLSNGYAILGIDGTPTTTADWGSYFKVGDKNERPAAISGLGGLSWVLTVEGLFSFNDQARSGLVFEDFRSWRNVFDNIPMPAWRGGLLIPHPTGLLFYTPGELPVNVGIETKAGGMPASGVTELHGGRYMGVHATGDYVWAIYQPLVSSTNVLILCGYSQTDDPRQLTWQVMGTATLQDGQHLAGVFVAAQGQPLSSTYFTPTLWFGDNDDLAYHVLNQRAGPFRSRADTHAVHTSAEAFMSTLEFPEPLNLSTLVVYTSEDRVSGDEWQLSIIDQNGDDVNVGTPIRSGAVRHERPINRHDISRLTLHVAFIGTSAASRVPPAIKRIELYGDLSTGSA